MAECFTEQIDATLERQAKIAAVEALQRASRIAHALHQKGYGADHVGAVLVGLAIDRVQSEDVFNANCEKLAH